jgi:hypothetical protein
MSDRLHCDIHGMLDVHLQNEQADLGEIAARVTEVLADLILLAPPAEQAMPPAAVVANLATPSPSASRNLSSRSPTYDAVAKRPNASGALQRSDNQAGALPSIQRCASCCVTKPGTCSRLPLGQATRTYHPEADLSGRASKAGFVLSSSTKGASRKT